MFPSKVFGISPEGIPTLLRVSSTKLVLVSQFGYGENVGRKEAVYGRAIDGIC